MNIKMKNWRNMTAAVVLIVLCAGLLAVKDSENVEYIASNAGEELELKAEETLSQTWLTKQKRISGFILELSREPGTDAPVRVEFIDRENGEVLRRAERLLSEREGTALSFEFDTIKSKSVKELEIQIKLLGAEEESIYLKVNPDYAGLSIDGEEKSCGLGSELTYIKNRSVFVIAAVLGIIFVLAVSLSLLCRKEFSDTVGMIVIGMCLWIYGCGLFGNTEIGILTIEVLATAGLVFIIYSLLRNKVRAEDMLSFSMVSVTLFFIFAIIYNYNTILTESDEFSHWALAAKDMFYSDKLASHEGTTVLFTRYPPFMSIFQYFFMYMNQVFSDKFLFIAYQLFGFTLLSVLLKGKRSYGKNIVLFLILCLFPLLFHSDYYNKIMIDGFLGILFAYVLYCFFFGQRDLFNWIRVTLGMSALVLTKEMGFVLAGIAGIVFLFYTIWDKRKEGRREELSVVLMGVITLISFGGWQLYCRMNIGNAGENSVASAAQMISSGSSAVLDTGESDFFVQVILNAVSQVWNSIKIGPFSIAVILAAAILLAYMADKKLEKKKCVAAVGMLSTGCILYFSCLVILYIFVFPRKDALAAASLDRYLFSYIAGLIFLVIGYVVEQEFGKWSYGTIGFLFCIVLYLAPTTGLFTLNQFVEKRQTIIWGYDAIEENFRSFLDKDDKVYFWCDDSLQMSYHIFRYYMCPLKVQERSVGCAFNGQGEDGETVKDIEAINSILKEYDYVYVANRSEKYASHYSALAAGDEIENGGLYRIEENKGALQLVQVGYAPIQRFY